MKNLIDYKFNSAKLFFNGSFVSNSINVDLYQETIMSTQYDKDDVIINVAELSFNNQLIFNSVSDVDFEILRVLLQFNKGNMNFCTLEAVTLKDKELTVMSFINMNLLELYISRNNNKFIFDFEQDC